MWLNTFFTWNLIFFRFMMKKNKDDLGNFEIPQRTQTIDTP